MSRTSRGLAYAGAAGVASLALSSVLAAPALAATSYPTTLSETVPSVITYGQSATVRGHLVLAGTPFPLGGEKVALYKRPAGGTTWTLVATHTTDSKGNAAFVVTPLKPEQFQLRHAKDAYTAASSSAAKTVKVAWRVRASLAKATVAPKATDTVTTTVAPNAKGLSVALQRKTSSGWTTVATKSLSATSTASFTITAPATAGKYTYRVYKAASSVYAAGVSPALVVTVS